MLFVHAGTLHYNSKSDRRRYTSGNERSDMISDDGKYSKIKIFAAYGSLQFSSDPQLDGERGASPSLFPRTPTLALGPSTLPFQSQGLAHCRVGDPMHRGKARRHVDTDLDLDLDSDPNALCFLCNSRYSIL